MGKKKRTLVFKFSSQYYFLSAIFILNIIEKYYNRQLSIILLNIQNFNIFLYGSCDVVKMKLWICIYTKKKYNIAIQNNNKTAKSNNKIINTK